MAETPSASTSARTASSAHGPIVHAEPYGEPSDQVSVGSMMGGAYIATSDSRFREATGIYGAVALHDRFETQEQCDDPCR